ncbi:MAG: transaldolase family protein, partial [Bombilactobacillus sp.]
MEFFLDTINLDKIAQFQEIIPVAGVTLTPSIIKREGKVDFFEHAKKIRQLIGSKRTLHIQLVAADCEQFIKDAQAVWQNVDSEVFVKIPLSLDGLKAIQYLKKQGPCH